MVRRKKVRSFIIVFCSQRVQDTIIYYIILWLYFHKPYHSMVIGLVEDWKSGRGQAPHLNLGSPMMLLAYHLVPNPHFSSPARNWRRSLISRGWSYIVLARNFQTKRSKSNTKQKLDDVRSTEFSR